MPPLKESILSQALALSETDRLEVVERLAESLPEPTDSDAAEAWDEEISRRLDDAAAGRAKFVPWEEARQRLGGSSDAAED